MSFKILKPESPTWNEAWEALAKKYGDRECEEAGCVWQYMATVDHGNAVEHQFRHRRLKGKRELFSHYSVNRIEDYQ